MAKNKFRRLVCGDPRAACFNLESAIRDLWCSLLVETLAAERHGIRRCKNGDFPEAWYREYCRRAGNGLRADGKGGRAKVGWSVESVEILSSINPVPFNEQKTRARA